jgi:hypothetical protein
MRQIRRMESNGASASLAQELGNNQAADSAAAWETNMSGLQETSMMRGAPETNAQEKETAATMREAEPQTSAAQEEQ